MKENPFVFSLDNKRYHTLNYHNKTTFGRKIHKAVIDCGLTCPNIDGTKGTGGCIFCDGGSGYFTKGGLPLEKQLESEINRIHSGFKDCSVIAYFQANTNTYAPVKILREIYYSVLNFPEICGISVGTRADCLGDDVLNLLSELNEKTYLTVELGMQTVHEKTIDKINRLYSHREFLNGYFRLKNRGIRVCLHIINGLPDETAEMMTETARQTAELSPDAVKLQMLHVIKGTQLEKLCNSEKIGLLTREEYTDIIVRQLEILPPETVIERITGDGDRTKLIAPMWSADKKSVLGEIDKKLVKYNTYQGKYYKKRLAP